MDLSRISSSVQHIAEVIASVIKVDVTIVDHKLNRIAATGCYVEQIGTRVNKNSVFSYALQQGEGFLIENPGEHEACFRCSEKTHCREYAQVCCPIKNDTETIGVIGLIAFSQEQKSAVLHNKNNLMEFLNRMADLIAVKLVEEEKTEKIKLLAKELETVLDAVDRGIIAVNQEGKCIHFNRKAEDFFGIGEGILSKMKIQQLLENISLEEMLKQHCPLTNTEFRYHRGGHRMRGIFNANPIMIESEAVGIVFTFMKISEALKTINDITTAMIETSLDNIIGSSRCFAAVKEEAARAAQSSSTILIQGESGTGKELFARAIHFHSSRKQEPFIPINCAAIPEQLLESELFGYEEGAFTGAKRGGKTGKFELANRGTIFLDEIGDMPLHLQTKLLRVLQENVIEKVGGKDYIPINVRVIAATNKNLEEKVNEGEFRKDLFYRLNVIPINIPPLRDRREDIPILVEALLEKCNLKLEKKVTQVDNAVLNQLIAYHWPGNVRELENTIEYAVNMCRGERILKEDLPNRLKRKEAENEAVAGEQRIMTIKELECYEIQKALRIFGGSKQTIDKAAEALGMGRATLYRKMKEYQLI
ncbi:PAS domain S-box-containing protein [Geosporobacter subterraneus DSM 17957]|uniref:PAS domain S-box-containing protein n=1 Tax=Geosporobacter subterraneus DSM 17957 TaxID=1121919 RepID=A0A1M6LSI0_9FIRM|nr:sigma 54-interacting transcriptional regulator [Geosporobacter subterraneus]SHJ74228.1 PAS domain S-box-containing protein [Geosporobacter subterraneus DSM 17957]